MAIVYANLGSNLGDSLSFIETAVEMISEEFGICCRSEYMESEPWGFESANRFLNLGVSFQSPLHPEEILSRLQNIEKTICSDGHRDSVGGYIDRKIDIDIMAIGEMKYESGNLTLPHPHLHERDFFLLPLKELNPEWCFPEYQDDHSSL